MSNLAAHPSVARPSVLFICTANRVRSPMAAALLRARLMMMQLDWRSWRIDSAGTWATSGEPALLEAQEVMARRGLDISKHRSRMVSFDLLRRFQLILTMEVGQQEALRVEFPEIAHRVYMLSEMSSQVVTVEDPVGGTIMDFEQAANTIDAWLSSGMDRICHLAQPEHR